MTRVELRLVAAASLLATLAVLAGGAGADADADDAAAIRTALAARTTTVRLPSEPAPAQAPAPAPLATVAPTPPPTAIPAPAPPPAPRRAPATSSAHSTPATAPARDDEPRPTRVGHVFIVALAGHGFDATFGPGSVAPYLATRLRPLGTLLAGYRTLGRGDLADHLALVSGQPPNAATSAGCPSFTEIPQDVKPSRSGEIAADGCVFPSTVTTIADQITAGGRSWRAYVEDLDRGPTPREACRRPPSNAPDDTTTGRVGDGYATRHNPFVYFHSLTDLGGCDAADGPLERLEQDLRAARTTPALSYVVPNLCNAGTESPCADGGPGGLAAADAFLASWVPRILASPAYRRDGVLVVTFAGGVAPPAGEEPKPNGTLVVSRFARPGATVDGAYDPYSLLRTTQDLLALRPLARAAKARSFVDAALPTARLRRPGDD